MSDKVSCPKCKGKGGLTERLKDRSDKEKERLKKCPFCKGTGLVDKKDRWKPR